MDSPVPAPTAPSSATAPAAAPGATVFDPTLPNTSPLLPQQQQYPGHSQYGSGSVPTWPASAMPAGMAGPGIDPSSPPLPAGPFFQHPMTAPWSQHSIASGYSPIHAPPPPNQEDLALRARIAELETQKLQYELELARIHANSPQPTTPAIAAPAAAPGTQQKPSTPSSGPRRTSSSGAHAPAAAPAARPSWGALVTPSAASSPKVNASSRKSPRLLITRPGRRPTGKGAPSRPGAASAA